jgi:hypothetical protein
MSGPSGYVIVLWVPPVGEETWASAILALAPGGGGTTDRAWKISYPKGMEETGAHFGYKVCKEAWSGPLTSGQYRTLVETMHYFKDDLTHGTDCVGLARAILRRVGIDLPKESQWPSGPEPTQYHHQPGKGLNAALAPIMSPVMDIV